MTQSTLSLMQEIEAAAQAVIEDYRVQIRDLGQQAQRDLDVRLAAYDLETQTLLEQERDQQASRLVDLQQESQVLVADHEQAVHQALTARRTSLVQGLVDKVVKRYGH